MNDLLPRALLVGVLACAWTSPTRAADCPGDCDGDEAVSVAELVVQVQIALGQRPVGDCPAADLNDDEMVRIDELVVAVASAVRGCPGPTPTLTSLPTASFTAAPPSATPTQTSSATAESTASATAVPSTPTPTPSASPTDTGPPNPTSSATIAETTPSETATVGASPSNTATATPTPSIPPSSTATATRTVTRTASLTATSSVTPTSTPTSTRTSTATVTPTSTVTPTRTATPAPGVRRFSLNPKSSGISTFSAPDMQEDETTGFEGYLDLALGAPDDAGVRPINIEGASPFLSLALGDPNDPNTTFFCLAPIIPVARAGVVDCDGGSDLGVKTTQDHVLDTADCAGAGGVVEQPTDPHPGACNGPLTLLQPSGFGDSGVGAVLIAPSANTLGFVADVSVDAGPCETHTSSQRQSFGFASGLYRVEILHADADPASTLLHDETGQNFDCAKWAQENGPGRLVLSIGVLHGGERPVGNGTEVIDLVTVITLDD